MNKKAGIALLLQLAAVIILVVVPSGYARSPADNHIFVAGAVSWHLRDGFYDFGNDRIEHIGTKPMRTQGIVFGKNFGLPAGLRLSVPISLEYGKVLIDTVFNLRLDDGTVTDAKINSVLVLAGFEPTLQLPWQVSPKGWAYLCIGGGIHYAAMAEEEIVLDGSRRRVVGDPWLEEGRRACFSFTAGQGLELTFSSALSLHLAYNFRFWEPVKRSTHRDLFPVEAVSYTERFFTHGISAGFFFTRERN